MSSATRLTKLLDLAQEPSSDKRRELLREVTDVFFENPAAYSDRENAYFGEIIGHVAFALEEQVRRTLAERFADVPEAPHDLIVKFANDAIAVARPVLTRSRGLRESDMRAIAERHGQDHLRAIASRPNVPATVTDAIVQRGDDATLVTLVSNSTAAISRGAMETLVQRAERNEQLHQPMVQRADVPADLLNEMFFFVSAKLRNYILERNAAIDEKTLDAALDTARAQVAIPSESQDPAAQRAREAIDRAERNRELSEAYLVRLLRQKQVAEFLEGFARLTGLDVRTARRILGDSSAEGLAIACKAARFDRATFSTIVLLADTAQARKVEATYELLAMYDKVPVEAAQRTMRFWKVRREAMNEAA